MDLRTFCRLLVLTYACTQVCADNNQDTAIEGPGGVRNDSAVFNSSEYNKCNSSSGEAEDVFPSVYIRGWSNPDSVDVELSTERINATVSDVQGYSGFCKKNWLCRNISSPDNVTRCFQRETGSSVEFTHLPTNVTWSHLSAEEQEKLGLKIERVEIECEILLEPDVFSRETVICNVKIDVDPPFSLYTPIKGLLAFGAVTVVVVITAIIFCHLRCKRRIRQQKQTDIGDIILEDIDDLERRQGNSVDEHDELPDVRVPRVSLEPHSSRTLERVNAHNRSLMQNEHVIIQQYLQRLKQMSNPEANALIRNYRFHFELGRGKIRNVHYATIREHNGEESTGVAIKEQMLHNLDESKCLLKEIVVMARLNNANVVKFIEIFFDENSVKISMVMEFVGSEHVADVAWYTDLTVTQILAITREILRGLHYLHRQNIIHRDIKGSNALLSPIGEVKLAGFGKCAQLSNARERRNSIVGTSHFMAPEVSRQNYLYSFPCDMWSLGATILQMKTGEPPHPELSAEEMMERTRNHRKPAFDERNMPPRLLMILLDCYRFYPSARKTPAQLLDEYANIFCQSGRMSSLIPNINETEKRKTSPEQRKKWLHNQGRQFMLSDKMKRQSQAMSAGEEMV